MSELTDQAEREVHDFVGNLARGAPISGELVRLLETLHTAERMTDAARQRLTFLAANGVATSADVRDYDTLRRNVFRAQMRLYDAIVASTPTMFIPQIPRPQLQPVVVTTGPLTEGHALELRALGNPGAGVAAGAAIATSPWFWAAIVLTILVALGILASIVVGIAMTSEAISGVAIAWVQSKAYSAFLERRWAAYQGCLAEGRSPDECARLSRELVPPPEFTSAGASSFWTTLKYATVIGGAGLLGFLGYRWYKRGKRKRLLRLLSDEA